MPFAGPNIEGQTPGASVTFVMPFYMTLASITAADLLNFPMPVKGRIDTISFSVKTKATTASKAATLTARLKSGSTTTSMTGGVLTLTSANMTPEAAVVNATAITALNEFNKGDSLVITASAVTAFAEGDGYLMIEVAGVFQ
jgi:hypothetical protein